MPPIIEQEVRKMASRKNIHADNFCLQFIEKMTEHKAFVPGRGVNPLVSKIRGMNILLELASEGRQLALTHAPDRATREQLEDWYKLKPRRWRYTTSLLSDIMRLHACEEGLARPMTLWIGKDLVQQSITTGKPLSKLLRKRLNDRLYRLLGKAQYDFWFQLEATRMDDKAIHAHGIVEVRDASWLQDDKKRKRLRGEIIAASGRSHRVDKSRILRLVDEPMNAGWITYCKKHRRRRFKWATRFRGAPTAAIGIKLDAGTQRLNGRSRDMYESVRKAWSEVFKDAEARHLV